MPEKNEFATKAAIFPIRKGSDADIDRIRQSYIESENKRLLKLKSNSSEPEEHKFEGFEWVGIIIKLDKEGNVIAYSIGKNCLSSDFIPVDPKLGIKYGDMMDNFHSIGAGCNNAAGLISEFNKTYNPKNLASYKDQDTYNQAIKQFINEGKSTKLTPMGDPPTTPKINTDNLPQNSKITGDQNPADALSNSPSTGKL